MRCSSHVKNWDARMKLCNASVQSDRQTIDGRECIDVEHRIPQELVPNPDVREYRYLSIKDGLFPVRLEIESEGLKQILSRTSVDALKAVETPAGTISIPRDVRQETSNRDGSQRDTRYFNVDESTLQINHEMERSDFKIPVLMAQSYEVQDFPQNNFSVSDPESVAKDIIAKTQEAEMKTLVQSKSTDDKVGSKQPFDRSLPRPAFSYLRIVYVAVPLVLLIASGAIFSRARQRKPSP
jgi:hypothetical protein